MRREREREMAMTACSYHTDICAREKEKYSGFIEAISIKEKSVVILLSISEFYFTYIFCLDFLSFVLVPTFAEQTNLR